MASIYDVAKLAEVSVSTAVRVLNKSGYFSKVAQQKVMDAAEKLNYAPSYTARSLKMKKTKKILFCIPDICNPFYFRMIEGAERVLAKYDYYLLLCHTHGDVEREIKMIYNLKVGYGDAIIILTFDVNPRNIDAINNCDKPVVLTNYYEPKGQDDKFDCVYTNTRCGIDMATSHMISQGHRCIGYIGGTPSQSSAVRQLGYQDALERNGIPFKPSLCIAGNFTSEGGHAAMTHLFAQSPTPTAIVCANDLMAMGAFRFCKENGIHIPDDLAVVGMDNSDLTIYSSPQLSSIRMREDELGSIAANLLIERLTGVRDERKIIQLEPELVLRQSSVSTKSPQELTLEANQ